MDYKKSAAEVIRCIGGKDNIASAAHCATRLRLVINDNAKCNKKELENVDGVKGVFEASGQLQIIFGTGIVNKVYEEFIAQSGAAAASKSDVKAAAAAKAPLPQRMIKALGDVFVPILPAIVASGLLMGILEGLCNAFPAMAESSTYTIFHMFSNAAFVFLPILVAISAARVFGGNLFLGAVIGMIMIHSDLINAWGVAGLVEKGEAIPMLNVWGGLYQIQQVGYQGHVIPVVIAVFLMSKLEIWLHKHVPEMIDLFVTPVTTVCVTGYLTLSILGPIFSTLENFVLTAAQVIITFPMGVGAAIVGAVYPLTVVCGIHHMYNVIEAGMIAKTGLNTWMPIASAANFAQGAACLAVAIKTRNKKFKSLALPASLSAFLGITEPAIFGVNLRFVKPLVAGIIGGACGSIVASICGIGATAYGVTGIFGFLITTAYTFQYFLTLAVSFVVAFAVSFVLYKDEEEVAPATASGAPASAAAPAPMPAPSITITEPKEADGKLDIVSPLTGRAITLQETGDETFAAEVLGSGAAVDPTEGKVYAPFDATVTTLMGHAVGLEGKNGVEILIHCGIDTVKLEGKHFTARCAEDDEVKAGDLLLEFDIDAIKKEGYPMFTPVIVTNSDDFDAVTPDAGHTVTAGERLITLTKVRERV